MNAKKYIILFIGILAVFLTAIFFYFYVQFNKESNLVSYIPKDAETVVYLNSKTMLKLFIKNRNDTSFKGFDTKYKDYFTNIKDPKNNGIDFLKDVVFIENKQQKYVLLLLKNEEIFRQNISNIPKNLLGEIEQKNGFKKVFSVRDSFTLCWSKNVCCFIPKQNEIMSDEMMESIFSLHEKENFSTQINYKNIQKPEALIWFYKKDANIKIDEIQNLKGYVNFQDSLTIHFTNHIENPYNDSTFQATSFMENNTIYSQNGNEFINKLFLDWTSILLPNDVKKIKESDLITYQKILQTKGKKVIENKSITYQYDDDFNKQKIEKITYDTINQVCFYAQKNDKTDSIKMSNSVLGNFDWNKIPMETKFYLKINQEFLANIYPIHTSFDIEFICQNNNKYHDYRLIIKTKNFKKLMETFANKSFGF